MRLLKKLLWISLLLALLLAAAGFGYYFAVTNKAELSPKKLLLHEKNVILYDKDNAPIDYTASFSHRETVKISELPEHTKAAFVDTEDKRFYNHHGFDIKRIAKAILNNAKSRSFKEGASTLSQQLIKNTHLSQEKTISRKLQEWKLTRQLEKQYTKEEILERYLNTIYFGHNCFGLHAAAKFYFNKSPENLSLSDSAILAGLVKSPNNYSPFKNPENCKRRKETVLRCMYACGHILEKDLQTAKNEPLPTKENTTNRNNGYCTFVFDELTDIAEKNGFVLGGKIEIYTGLAPVLQKNVEKIFENYTDTDYSCLILDKTSGTFKACVSTVGNARRLPGSIIKPLLVYAPALEENIISPATPILDEKVNYSGYTPENYDKAYHGYVSARECVAKSLNIPAVKILQSLGIKKGVAYLEKMGLSVQEEDHSLALSLGGMKEGFSLNELVSAYSTFQNGGKWKNSHFIKAIKINGSTIYQAKTREQRVFSEETAFLMTDMLQTAVREGTAKKLRTLPFDVAAKTGTVGTKNGNTDAYAVSYTEKDCIGVWLGNADNSAIPYTGGTLPCSLLTEVNQSVYEKYSKENLALGNFTPPRGVAKVSIDKATYYDTHNMLLADELSPIDQRFDEWFKTSAKPTKKSDFFSNPRISAPVVDIENNKVVITFKKDSPKVYKYRITRYDYVSHTTLYEGEFLPQFIDDTATPNNTYIYTITPMYADKVGTEVTLPTIHFTTEAPDSIVKKDWWQY